MALQKLLGGVEKLKKGKSEEVATSTLEGKTLLVYFSASWCPPCRSFTPVFSKFYKEQKEKRQDFEVVWVSWDNSEEQAKEYYEKMPWLALPFSEKKIKEKLNRKFQVRSIPTLALVDKEGTIVSTKARDMVVKDPEGKEFPWVPRSIYEILSEAPITDANDKPVKVDDLKALDAFSIYFASQANRDGRQFTPRLISTFTQMQRRGVTTQFIFASQDKDQSQYTEHCEDMPWAKMGFMDGRIQELGKVCRVESLPALVTVKGSDGKVLNKDALEVATSDPAGEKYPWKPVTLVGCNEFLPNDEVVEAVNTEMCVFLSLNDAANKETPKIEFTKAAEQFDQEFNKDNTDDPVRFFIVDGQESKALFFQVMMAVGLSTPKVGTPTVVAVNLSNDRSKMSMGGEISVQGVIEFAKTFKKAQTESD